MRARPTSLRGRGGSGQRDLQHAAGDGGHPAHDHLGARRIAHLDGRFPCFDGLRAITSTGGMASLVYGFIRAADKGWRDGLTLGAFGAAVVLLTAFVLVERRTRDPITPLKMFADRNRSGQGRPIWKTFCAAVRTGCSSYCRAAISAAWASR